MGLELKPAAACPEPVEENDEVSGPTPSHLKKCESSSYEYYDTDSSGSGDGDGAAEASKALDVEDRLLGKTRRERRRRRQPEKP